jgi:hypothetical protein
MRIPPVILLFLSCGAAAMCLSACALPSEAPSEGGAAETAKTGALCLSFDIGSKTILPSDDRAYTVRCFAVHGEGPAGGSFDSGTLATPSYEKSDLVPGSWIVTVQGLNELGHVIAVKTADVTVPSGITANAVVQLARVQGYGSLDLELTWLVDGDYDDISGSLSDSAGAETPISMILGARQGRYIGVLPAGEYQIRLNLKKHSRKIDSLTETVQVYAGYTSQASLRRANTLPPGTWSYSSGSPVYPIDFQGKASTSVLVIGAEGKTVYFVKWNSSNSPVDAAAAGYAGSPRGLVPYGRALGDQERGFQAELGRPKSFDLPEASAFNAHPPALPPSSRALPSARRERALAYGDVNPEYVVGTTSKLFWVQNSSSAWIQIPAVLRSMGRYCYIWVAADNFSPSSAADDDDLITGAQADALRDKFDGSPATAYSDGIFKNVTTIFGYEYGGGEGGDGGRDGDQHIGILIYDIDFDYAAGQTGGVLGYFWGKDFYPQDQLSSEKSNNAELFYVDCHFMDRYPSWIYSTLAHEYQHMINFNNKFIAQGLDTPEWADELCSMAAEDLVLSNLGMSPASDGPQTRLDEFNYHYSESGVTDWLGSPDTLKSYASAFAFGAYLERNYGGARLFQAMASNARVGEQSISSALGSLGYADSFAEAFSHFGEALVFSEAPADSSVKSLDQPLSSSVGGMGYKSTAIDLRSIEQYNRDAKGWVTGAYGPRTFLPGLALKLRPYGYSIHTQASWTGLTGDLTITVAAPKNPHVRCALMIR